MSDRDYRPTKQKTAARVVVALLFLIALGIAGRVRAEVIAPCETPDEYSAWGGNLAVCYLVLIVEPEDVVLIEV